MTYGKMSFLVIKIVAIITFVSAFCSCSSLTPLEKTAEKEVAQYTLDDCRTILSSDIEDICKVYDLNPEDDLSSLLLEERSLATVILPLTTDVLHTPVNYDSASLKNVIESMQRNVGRFTLVLYGEFETNTIIEGITNGMILDESEYIIEDTFWKGSEALEELPAKCFVTVEDDLIIQVFFTQAAGSTDFTQNSIHVTMLTG